MPRRCETCHHPERQTIETHLQEALPLRTIAGRFGLSKDALSRHLQAHMIALKAPAETTEANRPQPPKTVEPVSGPRDWDAIVREWESWTL